MKRARVSLAMMLIMTCIIALAAGCTSKNSSGQNSPDSSSAASQSASTPKQQENPYQDPVELSIAMWDIEKAFPSDKQDAFYDLLKKKFNITIKPINVTWDDYEQKMQVWAASGQLPDVFVVDALSKPYYKNWVKEKLVRPIPSDLSKYPNVQKLMNNPDVQGYKNSDGNFYAIPKPNYSESFENGAEKAIMYRKDWMESVGITKPPENTDEFIALMNAFIQKDPEKKKTIGLTAFDKNHFMNIALAYAPGMASGANLWIQEDGKWIRSFLSKQALPALKEIKKIYDAGAADKDIAVIKGDEGLEKFASGRAGALAYGGIPSFQTRVKDYWDKNYPDKKFEDSVLVTHYWKAPDGVYYRNTAEYAWSENYFNADTMDDKKMDRYLALHDFLLSDEGMNLLRYGFEGKDYKKNGDQIEVIRPKNDKGEFQALKDIYPSNETLTWLVSWDSSFNFVNPSYPEGLRKQSTALRDWSQNEAKPVPTNFALDYLEYPSKNKVSMISADDSLKVIISKDADKTYNSIVKGYYDQGMQQVLDELNDAAAKAGIK